MLELLEYAALAYNKKQPAYPDKAILMQSTQYGLRYFENTLKIIFRGTGSMQDLFMDLRCWKKKIPYGNRDSKIRVHSGFIDAYKSRGVRVMSYTLISRPKSIGFKLRGIPTVQRLRLCARWTCSIVFQTGILRWYYLVVHG